MEYANFSYSRGFRFKAESESAWADCILWYILTFYYRQAKLLTNSIFAAVLYGIFSIILLPFFLIMAIADFGKFAPMMFLVFLYPVMGFIGGIIGAAIYNLASRIVGGLEIYLETEGEHQSQQ
jgi:hypothetical protein